MKTTDRRRVKENVMRIKFLFFSLNLEFKKKVSIKKFRTTFGGLFFSTTPSRADERTKEIQICFILQKKKEETKESSKLLKELFETKRNGANVKVLRGWQGQSVNISLLIKLLYSSFLV
jgi:hypothetical protein